MHQDPPAVARLIGVMCHFYPGFEPSSLDPRTRRYVSQVPPEIAMNIVAEFEATLQKKGPECVRNPGAFIVTLTRRMFEDVSKEVISRAIATNEPPMCSPDRPEFDPRVLARIEKLQMDGFCNAADISERCRDMMRSITGQWFVCAV